MPRRWQRRPAPHLRPRLRARARRPDPVQTEQILFRAVPPRNLEPPTISGTLRVGERVTAHPGRWVSVGRNLRYEYTWVRCEADGGNCRGATDAGQRRRFRIQPADRGRTLKVTVWARDGEGGQWAQSMHTAVIENR